jgi:hypothetical protein
MSSFQQHASNQGCQIFLGTMYQNGVKYVYHIATKLPNGHNIHPKGRNILQMAKEYNDLFHSNALQNLPKL